MSVSTLNKAEATQLATEAYTFGFPLILMDLTRAVGTNVSAPAGSKAPMNQIVHLRAFPDYTFTDVVSPNADTLYSIAWMDLTAEALVLSVPDAGNRYYLLPLLDAWTNVFASPGSRTTGTRAAHFAITRPGWHGTLPPGVQRLNSPTNLVWMIGRTQTNGKADYDAVHAFQDRITLKPLSAWDKPVAIPAPAAVDNGVDTKTPPPAQVAKMSAAAFFSRMNALMKGNPPAPADARALAKFAAIDVGPGLTFDLKSMDPAVAAGVDEGARVGWQRVKAAAKASHGENVNGWDVLGGNVGSYGTDYDSRAVVALVGLGANRPDDAIYPHATADNQGQPLNGSHKYVVTFAKGQTPPVNAFWSLTMYNDKQYFVRNPLDRYAIGDRDALRPNGDGSLTIYIQHVSPGKDKESNWLPAPEGSFNVMMRLYWPKPEIVNGIWKIPPVTRID